jgi:hypothetical protein
MPPDSSHIALATIACDTTTVSKMAPTIVMGLPKLRVPWQNPPVVSAPPRANTVMDKAKQGVANSWHYPGLHIGDLTSSRFLYESQTGGFLHALLCELASSHPGFPDRDCPGTLHEMTCPGFAPWGGIYPYLVLWRGTYPF